MYVPHYSGSGKIGDPHPPIFTTSSWRSPRSSVSAPPFFPTRAPRPWRTPSRSATTIKKLRVRGLLLRRFPRPHPGRSFPEPQQDNPTRLVPPDPQHHRFPLLRLPGPGIHLRLDGLLHRERRNIVQKALTQGLLLLSCGYKAIRFLSPLDGRRREIDLALEILEKTLSEIGGEILKGVRLHSHIT